MNDGGFLVARVVPDSLGETLEWLGSDEPPFQPMDPLGFLNSAEIAAVYDLYKTQYLRIDSWTSLRVRILHAFQACRRCPPAATLVHDDPPAPTSRVAIA